MVVKDSYVDWNLQPLVIARIGGRKDEILDGRKRLTAWLAQGNSGYPSNTCYVATHIEAIRALLSASHFERTFDYAEKYVPALIASVVDTGYSISELADAYGVQLDKLLRLRNIRSLTSVRKLPVQIRNLRKLMKLLIKTKANIEQGNPNMSDFQEVADCIGETLGSNEVIFSDRDEE